MESMMRQLDPHFDFMGAFREETKRLTAQHFSRERIMDNTSKLARELERLVADAPGDTRRVLRRFAEGNLGRLQAPALEDLAYRINRKLRRLTDAIAAAALLIGGVMLVNATRDTGWHHVFGEIMVAAGFISTLLVGMAAFHRDRGRDGRR
jgi:ubiquinone biosynthesis protein